jgi:hypothetical protein
MKVGTHREIIDTDERRFDEADVVVVLDLPVGGIFEVFSGVEMAENPPAIVRWARGRVPETTKRSNPGSPAVLMPTVRARPLWWWS